MLVVARKERIQNPLLHSVSFENKQHSWNCFRHHINANGGWAALETLDSFMIYSLIKKKSVNFQVFLERAHLRFTDG